MVTLNAQGSGRYFGAAFLGLWLCGWLAGECFGLWLLGNAAVAMISGDGLGSGPIRIQPGAAVAMGGFVVLWLTIWTIGGIAALHEFFRLLCGEDRMSSEGSGLMLEQSRGPFRSRREIPRDRLRRFLITSRGSLAVETSKGQVELSSLGTREERENAVRSLMSELGITRRDPASMPIELPKGWQEIITPEGERAVVPDPAARRVKARILGFLGAGLIWAAAAVIERSTHESRLIVFAVQLGLAAVILTWAALWQGLGRMEYRFGNGVVTQRRRFGSGVKDVFEARGLELLLASERSDHGDWYALDAVSGKKRKRITSVARDPVPPRQLGLYLARAANVPFLDRTAPEIHAAEVAQMKEQLGKAGALGRFAVRLVEISEKRKQA